MIVTLLRATIYAADGPGLLDRGPHRPAVGGHRSGDPAAGSRPLPLRLALSQRGCRGGCPLRLQRAGAPSPSIAASTGYGIGIAARPTMAARSSSGGATRAILPPRGRSAATSRRSSARSVTSAHMDSPILNSLGNVTRLSDNPRANRIICRYALVHPLFAETLGGPSSTRRRAMSQPRRAPSRRRWRSPSHPAWMPRK